jgi:uncharacterized protein (DUF362 family)
MNLNRKEFLQTLGVTGAAAAVGAFDVLDVLAAEAKDGPADLVAVADGEPAVMFQKAIAELGGIERFVKKGQKIVIKPNAGWDRAPELAANTHPELLGEMVKQCLAAGAAEVAIFDSPCDANGTKAYKKSGIEKAVKDAGGKLLPGDDDRYFTEITLPKAKKLKTVMIHKALLDCDAWFNVPVLKHHSGAFMTVAMKNCMGLVNKTTQRQFHQIDLQQCIADICTYEKKPVLNVVDAYRIMKSSGPASNNVADAVLVKALLASTDIVAVDTAAVKLAQQFTNISIDKVTHISAGQKFGLGTMDIEKLNVKRIRV